MFLQSRNLIVAAACAVGCGIAAMVVAHDRGSTPPTPQAGAYVAGVDSQPANAPYSQTYTPYSQDSQAYNAAPQADSARTYDDGYYPASSRPVYVRQPEPEYAPPAVAPAPVYSDQRVVYENRPEYREHHHHHGRSKAHSAEIVAGSAGVGAAIGAIAGGGKGAAIGALAGGAGGFAYDRLTH
jgi:hypothetical protein